MERDSDINKPNIYPIYLNQGNVAKVAEFLNLERPATERSRQIDSLGIDSEFDFSEEYNSNEDYMEACLFKYNLNESALEGLSIQEKIQRFYKIAKLPVEHLDAYERDETRFDIELAINKFTKLLIHNENYVYEAFNAVRFESAEGVIDIETLHKAYRNIYRKFVQLSHDPDITYDMERDGNNCAQALNEFGTYAKSALIPTLESTDPKALEQTFPRNTNYLVAKYLEHFIFSLGVRESSHIDQDDFKPFEITTGRAAVFSADKTRIYIADKSDSGRLIQQSKKLSSEILYKEEGQYFARHTQVEVPPEMYDLVNEVLDSGTALASGSEFGVFADTDIRDYVSLLRSDAREVIEDEFGITLKKLSVTEQLYFLGYLKSIVIDEAHIMKNFTGVFGVEGMRTFLALERGTEDFGDKIVAFGQHEEVAGKVFSYYCELLDIAERAEELVREKTCCEGEVCLQLAGQVRENIMNRAQKDLERAVSADDVSQIEGLLGTYVAEAKEYVAILQELGSQETERVASRELSDTDKVAMLDLLNTNYSEAYPGEEAEAFRIAIRASLEKSFANPNTEFLILRDGEKIVSFNRFDTRTSDYGNVISYFGSFNADPAYSGVGGVVLEQTIKDQIERCDVLMAHCDPASDITKKYIESGFVAKETEIVAGKFSFEIWRTKDIADILVTKKMSTLELLERPLDIIEDNILVREVEDNDVFHELDEGQGFLLTRYFTKEGKTYVVFEIPSPPLWNKFQT